MVVTRAHAVRDVAVQLIGRVGNLLLGIVVVVTITRALGVDGTGEWSTLMAISMLSAYVADPGLQTAFIRLAASEPDHEAGWLGALVILRTGTAFLAAALCFGVSVLVATGTPMVIAAALISVNGLFAATQSLAVMFQLRVRNDRAIAFLTLGSALWTAGAVAVAALGGGLVAFAAIFLVTSATTSVAQAVYVWRHNEVRFEGVRRHRRKLLRIGLVLGVGSALTIAYGKIDQVLVLHYEGSRGAGLYGAAYSLLDRVQFIPIVLMTTMFPIISAAWATDPEHARRAVRRALDYMAVASFGVFAFTLGAARPILVLLFGTQFAGAAGTLQVLMAAFIPGCFGYVVGYAALVVDRQGRLALFAVAGLVVNVVGNLILLPRYGYIAAAWITLGTEIVVIVPSAMAAFRGMRLPLRLGRLPRIGAAAAVMGILVWLLSNAGVGVIIVGLIGVPVYAVMLHVVRALMPDERAELAAWLRRRARSS